MCPLTEDLGRSLPAKGLLPQNSSVNSQKISRRSFTLLGSPLAMASPVMWSKGTPKTSSSRVLIRNWQTLASCRWFRVSRQPVEQTSLSAPPPFSKLLHIFRSHPHPLTCLYLMINLTEWALLMYNILVHVHFIFLFDCKLIYSGRGDSNPAPFSMVWQCSPCFLGYSYLSNYMEFMEVYNDTPRTNTLIISICRHRAKVV